MGHLWGIWRWAGARALIPFEDGQKWETVRGVPPDRSGREVKRQPFTADQVNTLFAAHKRGTRMGDIIRFALVTGCRSNEMASLLRSDVDEGADAFSVKDGKTVNPTRWVPLGKAAQGLLQARLAMHPTSDRVFPEWPIRPSSGVAGSLPQAFTRSAAASWAQTLTASSTSTPSGTTGAPPPATPGSTGPT